MLKKEIYPKTKRVSLDNTITITEKIDGSNLCIFKKDGKLYIAQRNTIYEFGELESGAMYKGLYGWLELYKDDLLLNLNDDSVLCGEWVGMGRLKYNFEQKFLMFAKANITEDFTLKNINYNEEYFMFCFTNQEIPSFIGIVPIVYQGALTSYILKTELDELYKEYTEQVKRDVEGFIVNVENNIIKYVRMKNGKLAEHHASGQGE